MGPSYLAPFLTPLLCSLLEHLNGLFLTSPALNLRLSHIFLLTDSKFQCLSLLNFHLHQFYVKARPRYLFHLPSWMSSIRLLNATTSHYLQWQEVLSEEYHSYCINISHFTSIRAKVFVGEEKVLLYL